MTLRVLASRLQAAVSGAKRDRALDEEIETHLHLLMDQYVRQGLSPRDARFAARRAFGGVEQTREAYRDQRGLLFLEQFAQDVRFALRQLRGNTGFAITAILTLGLGIGVSAAMFNVVDAVLLRPLSYPDSERLVAVYEAVPSGVAPVNAAHFLEWQSNATVFDELALLNAVAMNLTDSGQPERLIGARVSPNLFPMLGATLQFGRAFTPEEDQVGRDRVIVLDDGLWRRRFGADPSIIGRMVTLNGDRYEVIGVLAPSFHFPSFEQLYSVPSTTPRPEFWKPFGLAEGERNPIGNFNYVSIGRLKRGVSVADATRDIDRLEVEIGRHLPQRLDLHGVVRPLHAQVVEQSRIGIELLFAAVVVVWAIGSLNLLNLWLVRSLARRNELAIREALGAGRGRLMRQVMVEAFTVTAFGAVAAVVVAYASVRSIVFLAPAALPRLDEIAFDARGWLYIAATAAGSALILGLVPARHATHVAVRRGTTEGRDVGQFRRFLVAAQVALTAISLVIAGLLLQSFLNLLAVDKGFVTRNMTVVELNLIGSRYDSLAARAAFLRALEERAAQLPGVSAAAVSNKAPLTGAGQSSSISLERTTVPPLERPAADVRPVSPQFFATWGIPLIAGRLFDPSDGNRPVAIVSEFTATHVWPNQNPIGQRFRFGLMPAAPLVEVIGVVRDMRNIQLDRAPSFAAYMPYWQRDSQVASLAVRTRTPSLSIASALRDVVRSLDPDLPLQSIRSMDDVVAQGTAPRRFQLNVVVLLAASALGLACLGLFGVLSYAVVQRRTEIGIRLALGAAPGSIQRLIARGALPLTFIGLALGLPAAVAAGYALRPLLFGLTPADPAILTGASVVIFAIGLAAAYVPARRAASLDPMTVLRCN